MRWSAVWIIVGIVLILNALSIAVAEDMRAIALEAKEKKAALLEKARLEQEIAKKEAEKSRKRILADKNALKSAISKLKIQNKNFHNEIEKTEKNLKKLVSQEMTLSSQLEEMDAVTRELVGSIRTNARDLDALLSQSLQSAFVHNRNKILKSVASQAKFAGMGDIRQMTDFLFDEIKRSGEVRIEQGPIVNRAGEETWGNILVLGNFTAAYQLPDEIGFLIYSDKSERLFALSKLPPSRVTKKIKGYMAGKSEDVPIDISRGGALRQLTHRLSLLEQIPKGGPIVWPILGICVFAVLIIMERFLYLLRMNINADDLMNKIKGLVSKQEWRKCRELCDKHGKKPLAKVILAGINFRNMNREEMENALQEAILSEIPHLERFLSTLGMLAAIAPLLGLLGTVTGMINTFHVITYYGTGDPRMMSSGISEALVTTMLGLVVAIPVMLCHTFLSRMVENIIGQMEEKSVAFVNSVFKARNGE